jgi:eukaryotic-like serine/threonine-protein kinase
MMSGRSNVTVKLPIVARAPEPAAPQSGSVEKASARPPSIHPGAVPFAPRVVGRYLLCDVFAAGGMATLHLGRLMGPEGFSRTVAIKQLHPQYAHDPKFVAMFLDEARLASRVHHPNVVSPLDVISHPPDLFIVMDYVHGEPLSRLLRRRAGEPVPPRVAAAIIGQVLLGLHSAHEATGESGEPLELVHRDVSPHNIMVTKDGVAKVVDFGIAKAKARSAQTERGMLKGKLGYMSPEQINLETVDRRADVFAVGVVLWEMLTGQRLFDGDTPHDVLQKLLEYPIPAPSQLAPNVPADLDHVVLAALARSTAERFDNARAMAQALDYALPAASMLELSSWVESRVGAELSARAEQVLDVESLSFDDFTRSARHPLSPPVIVETVVVPRPDAVQELVEPSALSVREPAAGKSRWKTGLILPALAFVCGASFLLWTRSHRAPAPVASGPTLVALPAPAKTVELAAQTQITAPSLEPTPVVSGIARRSAAALKPQTSASARPAKVAGPCDVPFTVDKHGVKRFKEACF